jgi:hypothetical protein
MHTEGAVPPIKNSYAVEFLHSGDNGLLVSFIATMDNEAAAKNWTAYIEPVEGADVAPCFANRCAQSTKSARHIVELTIKGNGEGCVRKC